MMVWENRYVCRVKEKKQTKKKNLTMEELTKGYEEFMKGKELREDGKELFEKVIKKQVKVKKKGDK
jgi:hypothetical protein